MSSDRPVALIIAAKDAAPTIAHAVRSALAQGPVAEVVVVDDASTDGTAEAAEAGDDGSGRLSVVRLARNFGPAQARNRGIASSHAPLVGALDADDHLEPDRIARLLAFAPTHWDMLADSLIMKVAGDEDSSGEPLIDVKQTTRMDAEAFVLGNLSELVGPRRELGFLKPLFRRAFLDGHVLAYDPALRLGEDYVLYAEALLRGADFFVTPPCGYIAIERANSLSAAHGVGDLAALAAADERLLRLAADQPQAAEALRRHRDAVQLNLDFRRVLDAKQQGHFASAMLGLFRTPRTASYILRETLRARAARRVG
ncbi:MAG: glycosyltransferase [Phenylobacterium sp.]|uniref:glycosyltransferase family 2 protein n=1 Tax=Phenylobacterium sp. TaxID=1871053 RepID=UPI0027372F82|nr:glycosyltransferase [Phenylobacterium sp.]MDP3174184.1 glycosyltransferase [Phenylobacterium sp.]